MDEQFSYVSSSSGFEQVGLPDTYETHTRTDMPVDKNGYLYVFVSNASTNFKVFFDNLQVTHIRGPLIEENSYYPFGLEMKDISNKALNGTPENKRKFNKRSELQNKEFSDESGLEWYTTQFRSLDPQIGKWHQIDPRPTHAMSLYSAMNNNPISFSDPLGDTVRIRHKDKDIIYNNGVLTNQDGSAYTGKIKGFLKQTVNALNAGRTVST